MKSTLSTLTVLGGLMVMWGCRPAFTARPPGVGAGVPPVEKRMFEYYDPLPDRSAGPDMQNRPREFDVQRAAPRRAKEPLAPWGVPVPPTAPPTQGLPLGSEYPGVIRE
jgi:hypothetical protein